MSEAMTVEKIIEAYWQLKDYWTQSRFPFQTYKGGWSDIDVLAYHPEKRHLVISESKAQYTKKAVFAYTKKIEKERGGFFEHEKDSYLSFLKNIKRILDKKEPVVFKDFKTTVKKLTIQIVSNYYLDEYIKSKTEKEIAAYVKKYLNIKTIVMFNTPIELFAKIIKMENEKDQGKRYGNDVIDIARELNRYFHPEIHYASKEERDDIKNGLKADFLKALGIA